MRGRSSSSRSGGTGSVVPDRAQTCSKRARTSGASGRPGRRPGRARGSRAAGRRRPTPRDLGSRSTSGIAESLNRPIRRRPGARSRRRGTTPPPATAEPGRVARCGPAIASRKAAASRTVRASGPGAQAGDVAVEGALHTRPRDGLMPNRPLMPAGMRIEPPPSLPCANGSIPAATAAAAPPLEPPASRVGSHGHRAGAAEVVVGVAGEAELGGVGLADADGAGGGQRRDHVVVDVGHEIGRHAGAERRPHTGGVVQVLDRGGDAVQRRQVLAREHGGIGAGGGGQRPLRRHREEGAEAGVEGLDPRERVPDELGRADLPRTDGGGLLERGEVVQLGAGGGHEPGR